MLKKIGWLSLIVILIFLFAIESFAYNLPQKYSTEEFVPEPEFLEEMANVSVPEYVERTWMDVWVNNREVVLSHKIKVKNGDVYLPVEDIFTAMGYDVTVKSGKALIKGDNFEAEVKLFSKKATVNGETVKLNKVPLKKHGKLSLNGDAIAKIADAKVWYDKDGNSLVISAGHFKDDEKLRIIAGKMYMNGEPYYEISFNKWDLYCQIEAQYLKGTEWSDPARQKSAAEDALKILHENGFKSIRFFCNHSFTGERYYEVFDEMLDLCDKYDIKVVACLQLPSSHYVVSGENGWDLICDENSESRKKLHADLTEMITRYKDRKTILMWEITNEGNLACDVGYQTKSVCMSIRQLGEFYTDCVKIIKSIDPDRPVEGGDSELRASQWHLYRGIREGYVNDWGTDTLEQRMIAYTIIHSSFDVISVHAYNAGDTGVKFRTSDEDDTLAEQNLELYMEEAKKMGKVLYDGETGLSCIYTEYDDENFPRAELEEYMQETIDAGVQLTHWWAFHTDRAGHEAEDTYAWKMDFGQGLEVMAEANRKIQERYCRNGMKFNGKNNPILAAVICVIVLVGVAVVLVATKKKKGNK